MALNVADKKAKKFVAGGGFAPAREQKIVNRANAGNTDNFNARKWAVIKKYDGTSGPLTGQSAQQSQEAGAGSLMGDAISEGIDPTLNDNEFNAQQARLGFLKKEADDAFTGAQENINAQAGVDRAQSVGMASDYGRQRQQRAVGALSNGMGGNPALSNELDYSDAYGEEKAVQQERAAARLRQMILMRDQSYKDYMEQALRDPWQSRIDQESTVGSMFERGDGVREEAPELFPQSSPAAPSIPVMKAKGKEKPFWEAANSLSQAQTKSQFGMGKSQMVSSAIKIAKERGVSPAKALEIVRKKNGSKK